MIRVGINGRFFPNGWRPAKEEIQFAQKADFASIQFPGEEEGLSPERLGHPLMDVGVMMRDAGLESVMEIIVRMDENGRTPNGYTAVEVLQNNLPAIRALGCSCVHWHPMLHSYDDSRIMRRIEKTFLEYCAEGVKLAQNEGFLFGIEHNAADIPFFSDPKWITVLLTAVPDLKFVWDFNHTDRSHLEAFLLLASRMSMLHIADAPLPKLNCHLPLGEGTIDIAAYSQSVVQRGFEGIGILEIGGAPWSGGFGQDTDAALNYSKRQLLQALHNHN
mgnify:CR=1 FL=1